tara:strand:+ start:3028 stop:3657 length:630 start_codon:yes stop_codon:yes gene_type:complete
MSIFTSLFPKSFKTFIKKFRKFNSLDSIDKKLLNYLNYKNGYYIECGANDGVDKSNTWYFEKQLDWHGLLIEPHPKLFKSLVKNRDLKNTFINKAIVNKNFKEKKIFLSDNDHTSLTQYEKKSDYIEVDCDNLTNILLNNNSPNLIDFFSLDVEGFEFEVLNGIDFNKYNFRYFLIETKNLEIINFLKNKNYSFIKKLSYHDYLFKYDN